MRDLVHEMILPLKISGMKAENVMGVKPLQDIAMHNDLVRPLPANYLTRANQYKAKSNDQDICG